MKQTDAFRVLASADRQLVLHELLERDGSANVDELSRQVAARRHRIEPDRIDDEKVEAAHLRLVHHHLPQLSERDLLEFDWEERKVSLADDESVDEVFEAAEVLDSWPPTDLLYRPS
ncbi:hypothetical protein ACFQGT_08990 [Natrialbaceae archaeon GCM10025810]|uniref:DUF7344 domain-containing protein n=1 Tax=Halovalidus salilacus TaxID=3075124 RepID=UPI00361B313C